MLYLRHFSHLYSIIRRIEIRLNKLTFHYEFVLVNECVLKGIGLYLSGLFVMILNIKQGKRRCEIKRSKK